MNSRPPDNIHDPPKKHGRTTKHWKFSNRTGGSRLGKDRGAGCSTQFGQDTHSDTHSTPHPTTSTPQLHTTPHTDTLTCVSSFWPVSSRWQGTDLPWLRRLTENGSPTPEREPEQRPLEGKAADTEIYPSSGKCGSAQPCATLHLKASVFVEQCFAPF